MIKDIISKIELYKSSIVELEKKLKNEELKEQSFIKNKRLFFNYIKKVLTINPVIKLKNDSHLMLGMIDINNTNHIYIIKFNIDRIYYFKLLNTTEFISKNENNSISSFKHILHNHITYGIPSSSRNINLSILLDNKYGSVQKSKINDFRLKFNDLLNGCDMKSMSASSIEQNKILKQYMFYFIKNEFKY